MLKLSKEALEERAQKNLTSNLPFLCHAFKITQRTFDLDEVCERVAREFSIQTTPGTLALILGVHADQTTAVQQWDAYVNFCLRILNNCYIPFIGDVTEEIARVPTQTDYVRIGRSKIYPSGMLAKRVIPEDVVKELKERERLAFQLTPAAGVAYDRS